MTKVGLAQSAFLRRNHTSTLYQSNTSGSYLIYYYVGYKILIVKKCCWCCSISGLVAPWHIMWPGRDNRGLAAWSKQLVAVIFISSIDPKFLILPDIITAVITLQRLFHSESNSLCRVHLQRAQLTVLSCGKKFKIYKQSIEFGTTKKSWHVTFWISISLKITLNTRLVRRPEVSIIIHCARCTFQELADVSSLYLLKRWKTVDRKPSTYQPVLSQLEGRPVVPVIEIRVVCIFILFFRKYQ